MNKIYYSIGNMSAMGPCSVFSVRMTYIFLYNQNSALDLGHFDKIKIIAAPLTALSN